MSFNHFNRRLHLYLAMFLLPWVLMYGLSSLPFSHHDFFDDLYRGDGVSTWTKRFERSYDRPVPQGADLRQIGAQILADVDLEGAFGAHQPNQQRLNIYLHDFWDHTRLSYFINEQRLVAEDRRFRWDWFFTGMHARGGFQQDSFLNDLWAVVVDGVCIGFFIWIASGIYMWWLLKPTRLWGALALGGGIASFIIFLLAL